jgi:hypothetical protein
MEAVFSVQGHPAADTFEEYAFKRLSEADTEALEEHVLVCPECQASLAEVDDYILLMKQATADRERECASESRRAGTGTLRVGTTLKKSMRRSPILALTDI